MIMSKPLWEGKNRQGDSVGIFYYNKDADLPFIVLRLDSPSTYYRTHKNGRYYTSERHKLDLMKLPKDFDAYLAKKSLEENAISAAEARKDAIMECNKVALSYTGLEKKAEARGALQCVTRLTALLQGKKPPKVKK